MRMVYLLHGFNVADLGRNTTDKFFGSFIGHGYRRTERYEQIDNPNDKYIMDLDYGWTGFMGVRLCDKKIGELLAKVLLPGSVIIAHSNGCAIASFAIDAGASVDGLVFINPALNKEWEPSMRVQWMDVYYNKMDVWPYISAVLPGHRWGAMGSIGPQSNDPRIKGIDTWEGRGHGGHKPVFTNFALWGAQITKRVVAYQR